MDSGVVYRSLFLLQIVQIPHNKMSDEWAQASGYVGHQPTAFHLPAAAAAEPSLLDRQTLVYRRSRHARDPVRTRLLGCIAHKPGGRQLELVSKVDATGKVRKEPFRLG